MEASPAKFLIYVLSAFLLAGFAYMALIYESPVTVVSEESPLIERSPRFVELLSKPSLSLEESEEMKREAYAHHQKLNPSSQLSFEEWKSKYIRVRSK